MKRHRLSGWGRFFLSGLPLRCLLLLTPVTADAAGADVTFDRSAEAVDVFDFVEITLRVSAPDAANPFVDATVSGEFAREGGDSVTVDGFCDSTDGSVYRIRFMPTAAGKHKYSVRYRQGSFQRSHSGEFTARDAKRRGQLCVDPRHPEHFVWAGTGELDRRRAGPQHARRSGARRRGAQLQSSVCR